MLPETVESLSGWERWKMEESSDSATLADLMLWLLKQ